MAKLSRYNAKRDFTVTAEPPGKIARSKSKARRFVIQRHDATRLHFDLRLELDGVYKSWAVTKVPSLDPATKRLAVEVEDHPIGYGTFEGTIPEGEYGGGTVQLWDKGTWAPISDGAPEAAFAKGHIKFELDGERLQGGWALIRLRDTERKRGGGSKRNPRNNWLLIKETDDAARPGKPDTLLKAVTSVKTGRTLEQIATGKSKVWHSNRGDKEAAAKPAAKKKAAAKKTDKPRPSVKMPDFVAPQLTRVVETPPGGADWVHEVKLDGYRMQLRVEGGKARLRTRTGLDWSERFAAIVKEGAGLPDCMLDGEVVALDREGASNFAALQAALSDGRSDKLRFDVFDLLFLMGQDTRPLPLTERKELLETMLAKGRHPHIRYLEHLTSPGEAMLHAACRLHLEGIISKRAGAPYQPGRGTAWTKAKCRGGQEVVIGGWTSEGPRFRSLLVGVHRGGKFVYSGRVGTGFNAKTANDLSRRLKTLEQKRSPFTGGIAVPRQGMVHWAKPALVAEIEFATVTDDGVFRQASFKGLREDKPADSIVAEAQPQAEEKTVAKKVAKPATKKSDATVSNPDKVLWPDVGITKQDLADYYAHAADRILPHIEGRPLSIVRAPDGIAGEKFFQRHMMQGQTDFVPIKAKGEPKPFLSVDSAAGLRSLAQAGVLEFHPWGCKKGDPETPERIIFDVDPDVGLDFAQVREAAADLKERLELCGLVPFLKTTGGKGLHVAAAIRGTRAAPPTWPAAKAFCKALCVSLERDHPDRYTTNIKKTARKGKMFLDYLRNDRTSTAVGAWSPRAREGATIAVPLEWRELNAKLEPKTFSLVNAAAVLKRADPWAGMEKSAGALEAARKKLEKL